MKTIIRLTSAFVVLSLLTLCMVMAATSPTHKTVIVAWDASQSTNVVGYKFYHGITSGVYTNTNNVGNRLICTNFNLIRGQRYYFAATAYTSSGIDSVFSTELVYVVPTFTLGSPTVLRINSVTNR